MYSIVVVPVEPLKHKAFAVPHVDRATAIAAARDYATFSDVAQTLVLTLSEALHPVTIFDSTANT